MSGIIDPILASKPATNNYGIDAEGQTEEQKEENIQASSPEQQSNETAGFTFEPMPDPVSGGQTTLFDPVEPQGDIPKFGDSSSGGAPVFSPPASNTNSFSDNEDEDEDDGMSEVLADLIMSLYKQIPNLSHWISKMPTSYMQMAELQGKLGRGTTEKVESINANNKKRLEFDEDSLEMVEKPLKKWLAKKGAKMSSDFALLLGIAGTLGTTAATTMSIRSENKRITEELLNVARSK